MDKWYEVPGKAGTNVIYSRVRLVRNLKEYPFPGRLTKEQSAELSEKLLGGLTGIASMDRMQYTLRADGRPGKNSAFRAPGDQPQCNEEERPDGNDPVGGRINGDPPKWG